MAAHLSLRLLGGFLLRSDARGRPLPVRKAQALLAYLALRAGRAHTREALTDLLWSGTADKQARQSLRQIMVRLRRTLAGAHRAVLVTQGDTVTVNPASLEIDVVQFERLVRRGTPDALEAAGALYQGPLLDGFRVAEPEFEEWLEGERARLHGLAVDALHRLVSHHDKAGRPEQAVLAATRLVALDPLQEDVHRTLMRLHARHGRRAAALRQYQACLALLQKELGVEPEMETKRLYLEILQRAAPAGRARAGAAGASRPSRTVAETPLIGREAEASRLRQSMRAAWRGHGHVVFVKGEAGIGKSRLVDELATAAHADGARVLVGRAHESEQILPFRPWVDALRTSRVVADVANGIVGSRAARGELARLFPELAGGAPPPPITADNYVRLFETIDALVGEMASTAPLFLVLEDLQWADELSLRLVSFAARHLAERPVLLIGTVREGEETVALQRTLTEVAALPHAESIALGGLTQAATAALVRALARADSRGALADVAGKVWTLSEGSPFVIIEMMRAFREGRLPDASDTALPRRVRDMILGRLDRLSPRARQLARVASAFTRQFEFPVLQRAGGLARRDAAEAVEELVRSRVFDVVGERFDFTHARVHQAVYEALLEPQRQTVHAAIGEAVESVYADRLDEVCDRLAYHFSKADEPAKALDYTIRLADEVARRYALEDAARLLDDALQRTARLPAGERVRRRLDVLYRLAHVLSLLGRSAEVREHLLAHEAAVVELRDPKLSGLFHFWLAYTYGCLGESQTAYDHARRSLEEAARIGDEITMGQACYELARETYVLTRSAEGISHGRQAVALLERGDEGRWWLGQVLWVLALHLIHVGDFMPALSLMERLRDLGEAMGERRLQTYAEATAGRVYTVMGETEEGIAAASRGVALAADPVASLTARGYLGVAYFDADQPANAIPLLEESVGHLQQMKGTGGYRSRQYGAWLAAILAEAYLMHGDAARAHDTAASALALAADGGWPVAIGYSQRAVGRVALAAGKLDDAERMLGAAVRTFTDCGAVVLLARARLVMAELFVARGNGEAATEM